MDTKRRKANYIIIIIVVLLIILVAILQMYIDVLKNKDETINNKDNNSISVSLSTSNSNKKPKTIKEIIENSGSEYISLKQSVYIKIYVNFAKDLYNDDGKSNESYFNDIIKQIVELKKDSFYLIDEAKRLEIFVRYNIVKDQYTITINNIEDFYHETDGKVYLEIENTEIVHQTTMAVTNDLYGLLKFRAMQFANTPIVTSEREKIANGYYYYPTEHIKAKLNGGKVLNLIFDKEYEEKIAIQTYVRTDLKEVLERFENPGFGSLREGYLGYRTKEDYVFFYGDEVSVYSYKYAENKYFDEYLSDYCNSGDLEKLVSDFTTRWSSYFEFEYDKEKQNLKLTFPTRGIGMDIKNNDSRGITIYNNYYLTDTVKKLIKDGKITLEPNKDLLLIAEKERRESMR